MFSMHVYNLSAYLSILGYRTTSAKFNHKKEGTGRGRFLCKLLTTAEFWDN
jgi:hypothetical protein